MRQVCGRTRSNQVNESKFISYKRLQYIIAPTNPYDARDMLL